LAEDFQGPVFILTDQFLADSFRGVGLFDIDNLDFVRAGSDPSSTELPYARHAVTDTGVSPRLVPGRSENLVVTDSDEHTEDGHLTEDLEARIRQVEKRLVKGRGLRDQVVPPEFDGPDDADLLLVSWGSSRGSVNEAASTLRTRGGRIATLHFGQVWPLVPENFLARLDGAKRVVCVEGNATGQLAGIIRKTTGFEIKEKISRYDGLPITPEFVLRHLENME
jgi:2-oxoglutarate ferredoxin oxidoreductase subunit alpha